MGIQLESLESIHARIRETTLRKIEDSIRYHKEDEERRLKEAESTRLAELLLAEAGIEYSKSCWAETLRIRLWDKDGKPFCNTKASKRRLAEAVRAVRIALGCRLEVTGKDVEDAQSRTVRVQLSPVDFPGVSVQYVCKLPRTAKCRIQKTSYSTLVCEV